MYRETDLPLAAQPVKGPGMWRWLAALAVLIAAAVAAFTIPLPMFYAYLPGPVRDVQQLVEIDGAESYSSEGNLYMTTVSVDINVTFVEMVKAVFDPNSEVIEKERVTGGQSFDDLEEQQRKEMRDSKQHAEEVALGALGLATPTGNGARIEAVGEGFPATGILEEGDVIVNIDGSEVETTCDVGRAVGERSPGDDISITVRRDGRLQTLEVTAGADPQNPSGGFLGIFMSDVGYEFDSGVDVEFETGDIAGPSAGLMFTLALYDQLTPDDLTEGKAIAGTGTIACDGGVGAIGGVKQKVAGAEAEGAEVFLSPAGNFAEARQAAGDGIEVVSVATFAQAIAYLESLD